MMIEFICWLIASNVSVIVGYLLLYLFESMQLFGVKKQG